MTQQHRDSRRRRWREGLAAATALAVIAGTFWAGPEGQPHFQLC